MKVESMAFRSYVRICSYKNGVTSTIYHLINYE